MATVKAQGIFKNSIHKLLLTSCHNTEIKLITKLDKINTSSTID